MVSYNFKIVFYEVCYFYFEFYCSRENSDFEGTCMICSNLSKCYGI